MKLYFYDNLSNNSRFIYHVNIKQINTKQKFKLIDLIHYFNNV